MSGQDTRQMLEPGADTPAIGGGGVELAEAMGGGDALGLAVFVALGLLALGVGWVAWGVWGWGGAVMTIAALFPLPIAALAAPCGPPPTRPEGQGASPDP